MSVHLEGMGWLGSAMAHRLAHHGVPFTWNDTDAIHTAWKACTGIVYPAGDVRSQVNLTQWSQWAREDFLPAGTVQQVAYCFAHKHPPHSGRYDYTDLGWLRVAHAPCFAVDVPAIVHAARRRFATQRTPTAMGRTRVIAHGFTDRCTRYLWGWSAPVRLEVPPELLEVTEGRTPAFYARAHRFQLVYAYPIPTRPGWWWAGSALVSQRTPRESDAALHLRRWLVAARTLYPKVEVTEVAEPQQGWRPRPLNEDSQDLAVNGNTVMFPPLWHSGVRWAPELVDAATAAVRHKLA